MPCSRTPTANTESLSKGFISDQSNLGNSLLQEWPHDYLALPYSRKEVAFSEYSEMRVYNYDRSCESKKSYSNDDRISFQAQTVFDASRIRNIISAYPLQTERAIHHAIDLGLLKREELVGIEHLVSEKSATNLIYGRRAHIALVLRAQELIQGKYENSGAPVMLAKVAIRSSSRNVKNAQARAAWSLNDENLTLDSSFRHSMRFKTIKEPNIRGAYAA